LNRHTTFSSFAPRPGGAVGKHAALVVPGVRACGNRRWCHHHQRLADHARRSGGGPARPSLRRLCQRNPVRDGPHPPLLGQGDAAHAGLPAAAIRTVPTSSDLRMAPEGRGADDRPRSRPRDASAPAGRVCRHDQHRRRRPDRHMSSESLATSEAALIDGEADEVTEHALAQPLGHTNEGDVESRSSDPPG
jgi:hypothetical protein